MTAKLERQRVRFLLAALIGLCATSAAEARVFPYENVLQELRHVDFKGRDREILVLRPAIPPSAASAPAVVLLHYFGGTPQAMANLTVAMQWVRDRGAWVYLPQGTFGDWSDSPTDLRLSDDVGFLSQLIQDAVAQDPIDHSRVYMAGYSRGGAMSLYMACERPDLIAAVASVASTLHQSVNRSCSPSVPVPVLLINGTADDKVGYDKRTLGNLTPMEAFERFASFNGCTGMPLERAVPDKVDDETTVSTLNYDHCSAGSAVGFYRVEGGGHTWPGAGSFVPEYGPTTKDIDATVEMWNFFQRFSRP